MSFDPYENLPGCMMPDGGDCCGGYSDLIDDWHAQRREIEQLLAGFNELKDSFTRASDDAAKLRSQLGKAEAIIKQIAQSSFTEGTIYEAVRAAHGYVALPDDHGESDG